MTDCILSVTTYRRTAQRHAAQARKSGNYEKVEIENEEGWYTVKVKHLPNRPCPNAEHY